MIVLDRRRREHPFQHFCGKVAEPDPHIDSVRPASHDIPLLEYDPDPTAYIEPGEVLAARDMPAYAVLCFFAEVIERLAASADATRIGALHFAHGEIDIWEMRHEDRRVAVIHPGVGAPLAAATLEEMIALGCTRFVVCGGAGALTEELTLGHAVVVESALRDEGTSFHYLPPSRTVSAAPAAVAALRHALDLRGIPHLVGRTWTTDGLYRETWPRIERRRREGCVTVEMEAAALLAVAAFRGVPLGCLLYAGDSLAGERWDGRDWDRQYSVRERVFHLAVEACVAMG